VADVGAQLTEVAVLVGGSVAAARRADVGTSDLIAPSALDPLVRAVAELLDDLRGDPACRDVISPALRRGVLLVGGGAAQPGLAACVAAALRLAVRPAAEPRLAAVRGAALAALSTLRRTAATRG
jgi:rod shape-determining protein MreB